MGIQREWLQQRIVYIVAPHGMGTGTRIAKISQNPSDVPEIVTESEIAPGIRSAVRDFQERVAERDLTPSSEELVQSFEAEGGERRARVKARVFGDPNPDNNIKPFRVKGGDDRRREFTNEELA